MNQDILTDIIAHKRKEIAIQEAAVSASFLENHIGRNYRYTQHETKSDSLIHRHHCRVQTQVAIERMDKP